MKIFLSPNQQTTDRISKQLFTITVNSRRGKQDFNRIQG